MGNILIACPIHQCKEYAIQRWVDNVNSFTYPDVEILLVDNTFGAAFHKRWKEKIPVRHVGVTQTEQPVKRINKSMALIQRVFVNGEYDWWFNLEIDVLPDKDILEKMLKLSDGFDLVSHAYPGRKDKTIEHQGIGCSLVSKKLARRFNFENAGSASPDGWIWSKVRATSDLSMMDLWGMCKMEHIAE